MIIKDNEFKNILIYALKPYFDKYGFQYVTSDLNIDHQINVNMTLLYNNQKIIIDVMFVLDYERKYILFKDIKGIVKYSFLELSFMQLFKQMIKIPSLIIRDNSCLYPMKLPIESISVNRDEIEIKIRE